MLIHKLLFNLASWHFKRYRKLTLILDRMERNKRINYYKKLVRRMRKYVNNQESSTCDSAE